MDIELNQADFFHDPYPYYKRICASGRPYWLAADRDLACEGMWIFSRYSDAQEIFTQSGSVSKNILQVRNPASSTAFDHNMLNMDGAGHLRLRRLVEEYFSVAYVRGLEPRIEAIAAELVNELARKDGVIDLVADFAEPLPLRVIAGLIGIPVEDTASLRGWSVAVAPAFDSLQASDPAIAARKQTSFREFIAYVNELVDTPGRVADGSMLNYLCNALERGEISRDELVGMIAFMLFAGHETTINLISSAVWLLLRHPQQLALLRGRPELLGNAVEEVLRYESPAQRSTFRIATAAVDIGGFRVEPGQLIGVFIGAANRDERVFERPDEFDIQRSPNRHLAFGIGLHNCLGKTLARSEARIALAALLAGLPGLRLAASTPDWRRNSFFRALASLPARLD